MYENTIIQKYLKVYIFFLRLNCKLIVVYTIVGHLLLLSVVFIEVLYKQLTIFSFKMVSL